MIGLILGAAALGSSFYGAEKSMQIDSRTKSVMLKLLLWNRKPTGLWKLRSRQQMML